MKEQKLRKAVERVGQYLCRYGAQLPLASIVLDPELEETMVATHRHPATVVAREASVPESVIAHELVHIAQKTLEQFRGFRLLYVLLAEGLAEWVAKALYPAHEVRYPVGFRLMELLITADEGVVGDLIQLNYLSLVPEDVDTILASLHLAVYSRNLLSHMAERIGESIRAAQEAGITDPTFVTLGEEMQAWKFLLSGRFDRVREEVDRVVGEWFNNGS